MFRLLLIVVILVLALVGGTAVALYHFFGWKGLIALPFLLIALLWVGKIVVGKPATARAWLHYYNEPVGTVDLPAAIKT